MEDGSAMDNKDFKDIIMEDSPTVMFGRKTLDDSTRTVHEGKFGHCDVWKEVFRLFYKNCS